jgi:hypothetical protein
VGSQGATAVERERKPNQERDEKAQQNSRRQAHSALGWGRLLPVCAHSGIVSSSHYMYRAGQAGSSFHSSPCWPLISPLTQPSGRRVAVGYDQDNTTSYQSHLGCGDDRYGSCGRQGNGRDVALILGSPSRAGTEAKKTGPIINRTSIASAAGHLTTIQGSWL